MWLPYQHRLCSLGLSAAWLMDLILDYGTEKAWKRMKCEGDPWRLLSTKGQDLTYVFFIAKYLVHGRCLLNISSKERVIAFQLDRWCWYQPTVWHVFKHLILSVLISKTELSIPASVGCFTEWMEPCKCKHLASHHNAWHTVSIW